MKARQIIEALTESAPAAPAPVKEPGVKPKTNPAPSPEAPRPKKYDNPWRRRHVRPGQEPAPKAAGLAGDPATPYNGSDEENIRALLRDPSFRQKAALYNPDDGTPEWEDGVVRRLLTQKQRNRPISPTLGGDPGGMRRFGREVNQMESVRARDLFA